MTTIHIIARKIGGKVLRLWRKFKNGVVLVEWTLYPDGRYFMDEDGYGMEDND